ncbi:serine/threonine phosphatase PppA [Paralimibaculum aggregatum]|uniref:Serine/threonine phosphatase PppA n=1 Tax=Paralimibaculum aggregatum TaxID=3036245 RepID=A0ABQ6LHI9_9RHOB|nr:protein phosphatase 2C domain-containing protein [Limibaculum sp. NKW23]GMG81594.1 serine/threonine phosphatase PppA [Limibaculum sp. NKW23]
MNYDITGPVRYSMRTHVGKVRSANEDAILALPELHVWAVADGMGGHQNGAYASSTITESLSELSCELAGLELMQATREAILSAHAHIHDMSVRNGGTTMGSTVVVLIIAGGHFVCLWAGDSRLYLLREGELIRVSRDHSLVADMVDAGQLTDAEAENHPHSNVITRAVGVGEALEIDKRRSNVLPGDRFLLCSDGLTKYADDLYLRQMLRTEPIETVSDKLLQAALDGGGADNISIIVVEVPPNGVAADNGSEPEDTVVSGL